ncbi:hypothetical protein THIOM_003170 [Candidatus Thiomargarita nelsonii]|uniref:Uncharacterized protein n=1 Tax=Candidatus Thiomargarita nelsonii TaxID=1003181 RepID=A0A176RZ60_9GAMM|nr:hypothetical protein THIOM_003170 [Candidatus Thiomargarita nelsonii]
MPALTLRVNKRQNRDAQPQAFPNFVAGIEFGNENNGFDLNSKIHEPKPVSLFVTITS